MKTFRRVSMSKPLLTSLAAFLILLAGATLLHAGTQDFTLVNNTGLIIRELYLSPAKSDDWGADVLGVDVLGDRNQTYITFSPVQTAKSWDLMIVDEDGDEYRWNGLRLNEISRITLSFQNGVATADFE
jgi:hypothetical protein